MLKVKVIVLTLGLWVEFLHGTETNSAGLSGTGNNQLPADRPQPPLTA